MRAREEGEVVVRLPEGLHLAQAQRLAALVRTYEARVTLQAGNVVADATDLLDLLRLRAGPDTRLRLKAWGPEARQVARAVAAFLAGEEVPPRPPAS